MKDPLKPRLTKKGKLLVSCPLCGGDMTGLDYMNLRCCSECHRKDLAKPPLERDED